MLISIMYVVVLVLLLQFTEIVPTQNGTEEILEEYQTAYANESTPTVVNLFRSKGVGRSLRDDDEDAEGLKNENEQDVDRLENETTTEYNHPTSEGSQSLQSCGPPPIVQHASIEGANYSTYNVGSVVTYKCDSGFVEEGTKPKATCFLTKKQKPKWKSPKITCVQLLSLQSCGTPPIVERASIGSIRNTSNGEIVVTYECEFGFVQQGTNRTAICKLDGTQKPEWIRPKVRCIHRSCDDPGNILHGFRIGSLFIFASNVTYKCDEGYKLNGQAVRFCMADGSWSGNLPSCVKISCPVPESILNGNTIYFSLDYGSELKYECNEGFKLQDNEHRLCMEDGTWSGATPTCSTVTCDPPIKPEHGSVQVMGGNLKAGSIAIYSCEEGMTLVGAQKSKCSDIGQWIFPAPTCLESCVIPNIVNGHIGEYNWRNSFVKASIGTRVPADKNLVLLCKDSYVAGTRSTEVTVSCSDGAWSADLSCLKKCSAHILQYYRVPQKKREYFHEEYASVSCKHGFVPTGSFQVQCNNGDWIGEMPSCREVICAEEPPPTKNAYVLKKNNRHDGTVEYHCDPSFKKTAFGNITCRYGKWEGVHPVCKPEKCSIDMLRDYNVRPEKEIYSNREYVTISCKSGFLGTGSSKVQCNYGDWNGEKLSCREAEMKCTGDPPPTENGFIHTVNYEHDGTVTYLCTPPHKKTAPGNITCRYGKWEGVNPVCKLVSDQATTPSVSIQLENPIPNSAFKKITPSSALSTTSTIQPEATKGSIQSAEDCFCQYRSEILNLKAYVGETALTSGAFVKIGDHVKFFCDPPGYFNLVGLYETTCFLCGKKLPSPTCTPPQPGEVVMDFKYGFNINKGEIELKNGSPAQLTCAMVNILANPVLYLPSMENVQVTTPFRQPLTIINVSPVTPHHAGEYSCYGSYNYVRRGYYVRKVYIRVVDAFSCGEDPHGIPHGRAYPVCRQHDCSVNFVCDESFEIRGHSTVKCQDGVWRGFPPTCTRKASSCDEDPPVILHGRANPQCRDHNCTVNYVCDESFQLSTHSNVRCHDGIWKGTPPTCTLKVECPVLTPGANMQITYSENTKEGSDAFFFCSDPWVLQEDLSVKCLHSGQWSGEIPSCILPKCSVDSLVYVLPDNVYPIEQNTTGDEVSYGFVISLACTENKFPSTKAEAKCGARGKWEFPTVECVLGCSPIVISPESVLIVEPNQPFYQFGDSISLSCPAGRELTAQTEVILCLTNGWTEKHIPDCE